MWSPSVSTYLNFFKNQNLNKYVWFNHGMYIHTNSPCVPILRYTTYIYTIFLYTTYISRKQKKRCQLVRTHTYRNNTDKCLIIGTVVADRCISTYDFILLLNGFFLDSLWVAIAGAGRVTFLRRQDAHTRRDCICVKRKDNKIYFSGMTA